MAKFFTSRTDLISLFILGCLAAVPLLANALEQPYYMTLVSRIMVFALAAVGLNLVLGFGGMVSFGHALYVGIGAYAVGILSFHGVNNGYIQLLVALAAAAAFAIIIGAIVVRSTGMTFIMITLAFAQMGFFLAISLKQYGGDDGLPVASRSLFFGLKDFLGFNLDSHVTLYYAIFATLLLVLWLLSRVLGSRFGLTLRGIQSNERRLQALGYATARYKLLAYVMSALICALAGFWLANLTKFAAPSYMAWTVSGELIVMAVLGGMGYLLGPVVGALVLLLLEEFLSNYKPDWSPALADLLTNHWLGVIGILIFVFALFARHGILGALHIQTTHKVTHKATHKTTEKNADAKEVA